MKQKTKIIIASVVGLVAAGGIAFAAQGYNEHKQVKRLFAPGKIIGQMDTDGDNAASRDELVTFARSRFQAADADNDQQVTKAEIISAIAASNVPERLKSRSGRIADRIFLQGDINRDGNLTIAEVENRLGKMHTLADWNDDNIVEVAEIKRLRGGFGHRRHKEGQN